MKLFNILNQDAKKVMTWFKSKEQAFISAAQIGVQLTTKIESFISSPQGKTIEDFVKDNVPQGQSWTQSVSDIVISIGKDLTLVQNKVSQKGILLRLLAEILSIVEGGVNPQGIDGYISEAQKLFI